MKKLMVVMAMVGCIVVGGGNVLADEPSIDTLNRHAVWSNWFDNDGNRVVQEPVKVHTEEGLESKVSIHPMKKAEMNNDPKKFDFIRETQYYDYSKDHRDSA